MYSLLSMVGFHRLMMPPLHTHRLDLQPLALTDLHTIKSIVHEPQFMHASYGCQMPTSTNQLLRWIIEQCEQHRLGHGCCYTLRPLHNPLIGLVALQHEDQRVVLSYWLSASYWQQGLMSEALFCILQEWQRRHPSTDICAYSHIKNSASLALLTKLEMQITGENNEIREFIWRGKNHN